MTTEQLAQLRDDLVGSFDLEELRTLCFDLGLDYDELRGEVKSARARDLITVMLRQNRLAELASRLHFLRPKIDWPDVEAISSDERLAWTTATEMRSAADYLAAVRDYCASLPYLSLHDIRQPKSLDEVYVPLKARQQPREKQTSERESDDRGMRHLRDLAPLSIADVMRKRDQPHVLILGEPGAGKSTLLRQMAERAWDAPGKIGLDVPCLPILVPLRRLAESDGSLEERLHRALTGELALTQDLPQGFFTQWPNQTGANWLLLLDALDEVSAEQRPRLMDWLKRILKTVEPNRIVITSRPSGYSQGELDVKLFGHYDLLSFTPEQTGEFARKWFGDKPCEASKPSQGSAEHFLQELDRVRAGDLRSTPLLLTIAAKVYLEKGTLPERRSALYDHFVDIWLAEAKQRGLRAELGDPVCDLARFALARLALAMTQQPAQSEASLSQVAAAYLRDAVPLSADRAQVVGARFVRVMARRSGVFTRRGDKYDFIHTTYREYLAAWAVVWECKQDNTYDLDQVWHRVVSHWVDENWREVTLFALGVLSDAGQDVTDLIRCIWQEGTRGLYFAGAALTEQATVETRLGEGIMDALLARERGGAFLDRSISILEALGGYSRAGDGLLALACDEKMGGRVRERAAEALNRLGRAEEATSILLALARDKKVDTDVRERTVEALDRLGRAEEAASILLALARDKKVDEWVRERAVEGLDRLGRADDLLALACDEKMGGRVRAAAAEPLGRLGRTEEAAQAWLALARDEKVDGWVRERAVEALGRLGRAEEAVSILLALARDEKVDTDVRMDAAEVLGRLTRADDLLALACDEKMGGRVRERAAEALGRLGRAEEAASILLALARDEKVDTDVRMDAAEVIDRLGRAGESASILLALAHDKRIGSDVRRRAAAALDRLGRAEDLLALARDDKADTNVRVNAIEVLGWFAETHVLRDLEHIAQEDKDEDVRRAAQWAIERIRRRASRPDGS